VGGPGLQPVEPHRSQGLLHPPAHRIAALAPHSQRESHVLAHAEVRKQHGSLVQVHHAATLRRERGDILSTHENVSVVKRREPRDGPQKRRLAHARRPHDQHALAAPHAERYVCQSRPVSERRAERAQLERRNIVE
jgi:hypothetical protein